MNSRHAFILRRSRIGRLCTAAVIAAGAVAGLASCGSDSNVSAPVATPAAVAGASRRARAAQLARLLDQVAAARAAVPVPNQAEEI